MKQSFQGKVNTSSEAPASKRLPRPCGARNDMESYWTRMTMRTENSEVRTYSPDRTSDHGRRADSKSPFKRMNHSDMEGGAGEDAMLPRSPP